MEKQYVDEIGWIEVKRSGRVLGIHALSPVHTLGNILTEVERTTMRCLSGTRASLAVDVYLAPDTQIGKTVGMMSL